MSKIKLVFVCYILCTCIFYGQEEVLTFTQEDGAEIAGRKKEGYSFSNEFNGDFAIVLIDRKNIFANLFNSDYKKIKTVSGEKINNKYSELIGYQIENDIYKLLFSAPKKGKYAFYNLDFNNNKTYVEEFEIDFDKESYIETIQYKNKCIILSATKQNQLALRTFNENTGFNIIKKFDITYDNRSQKLLENNFLRLGFFGKAYSKFTKIDNRTPNAIEQTNKPNKIYIDREKLYLTSENEKALLTMLHIIDLESLELATKIYEYPKGKIDDLKKYNSFILDGKILHIGSNKKEFVFTVKDFNEVLIKDFYFHKNQPIPIKNSPIIQDGSMTPFISRRKIEETSKFLRKISAGNLGLTAFKKGNEYKFTIGGSKTLRSGGAPMITGGGGTMMTVPAGGGVVFFPTYNITYTSFNSYSTTKSTFFNTTFDKYFNYIKKEEESNIFDIVKEFKRNIKYNTADDVFFHNSTLHFGYYDTKSKKYHLFKL